MTKRTFIVLLGVALVAVLATGSLIASNMGFKLNYLLQAQAPGVSKTGTNTIALPYNPQANIVNVGDLFNDIGGSAQELQTFVRSDNSFKVYSGGKGQVADPVVAGVGMRVKVGSDSNYIIAGSHNPGLAITLYRQGDATPEGASKDGSNEFAVPYHTTSADVGQLLNDIGSGDVQEMQTFVRSDESFTVYSGGKGQVASPIVPGASIRIKMGNTVAYIPSHY